MMPAPSKRQKEKLDKFFTNEGYYFQFEAEVAADVELPAVNHTIAGLVRRTALFSRLSRNRRKVSYFGRAPRTQVNANSPKSKATTDRGRILMPRCLLALALAMLWASAILWADGLSGHPVIIERRVGIKNLEDWTGITFWLRKHEKEWVKYSLRPTQTRQFRCGDRCFIYLSNKGKTPIEQVLQQRHLYGVYWDKHRHLWNVRRISPKPSSDPAFD